MRIRRPTVHLWLLLVLLVPAKLIQGEWTPQSRFWKHIQETQSGLTSWWWVGDKGEEENNFDEGDQYDKIKSCLNDNLPEETARELSSSSSSATVVHMLNDTDDGTPFMVQIQNAISPHEAVAVKALAACAREHLPGFFEHRQFETGGNDVTFLNTVLQIFLPQVAATVQRTADLAYQEAKWHNTVDYPPPGTMGLRTTEYLSYRNFRHLGEHDDVGSTYTVLFALSDPDDYEGGEYYIKISDDNYHYTKPEKYSAIVFLSKILHGVTDIESGHREMFTNELWEYEDPPWHKLRPYPEYMELFLERCEGMDPPADGVWPKWPTKKEVQKWLAENGREEFEEISYSSANDDEYEDESEDEFEDEFEDNYEDENEDENEDEL